MPLCGGKLAHMLLYSNVSLEGKHSRAKNYCVFVFCSSRQSSEAIELYFLAWEELLRLLSRECVVLVRIFSRLPPYLFPIEH